MVPLEILEAHRFRPSAIAVGQCMCDLSKTMRVSLHRTHVAQVLDEAMREREADAWQAGYEDGAVHAVGIRSHIDGLTERDPKRPANPYREQP